MKSSIVIRLLDIKECTWNFGQGIIIKNVSRRATEWAMKIIYPKFQPPKQYFIYDCLRHASKVFWLNPDMFVKVSNITQTYIFFWSKETLCIALVIFWENSKLIFKTNEHLYWVHRAPMSQRSMEIPQKINICKSSYNFIWFKTKLYAFER